MKTSLILLAAFLTATAAQGQWQENGIPVCPDGVFQGFPAAVGDGSGGAIIAFPDSRAGNYDIFAQWIDSTGLLRWGTGGVPVCTSDGSQNFPAMSVNSCGGAIITWMDGRNGINNNDIYAQSLDSAGSALWAAGGAAVCAAAGQQYEPAIIEDGCGGAYIVWKDYRNGNPAIYAQRLNAQGEALWEYNGVAVCTVAAAQDEHAVVGDGCGGLIIAWRDLRNGNHDIYAQRIDSNEVAQWGEGGLAVCTNEQYQGKPSIASDGPGGAVIIWDDNRDGKLHIRGQRLSPTGIFNWVENGMILAMGLDPTRTPRIIHSKTHHFIFSAYSGNYLFSFQIDTSGSWQWYQNASWYFTAPKGSYKTGSDGDGGVILVWEETRYAGLDIFAQRISHSGEVLWLESGVEVCKALYDQREPCLAVDGGGGALIAWLDLRNSPEEKVYAQKVYPDGQTGIWGRPVAVVTEGITLGLIYPNPFNGKTTINYQLNKTGNASLDIYNVHGQRVRSLMADRRQAGSYRVSWDGRNDRGLTVSTGVYLIRLTGDGVCRTAKVALVR